jgi:hypothetical protein
MESQQMIELLLKETRTNQAKMEAGHKELLAKLDVDRKTDKEEMLARIDANMKAW